MAIPRRDVVNPDVAGVYHALSRCVRRAFLLDDRRADRREWLEAQLSKLLETFAFDLHAFAILGNHFHLVVASDPARARRWSSREVARRWLGLFSARWLRRRRGVPESAEPTEEEIGELLKSPIRIEMLRRRLHDLSWLLKSLKEPIARRANLEDGVKGHFWEGRFRASALLDDAAAVAVCAYVDLNEVRAGTAATPEESLFSSVRVRAARLAERDSNLPDSITWHQLGGIAGLDDRSYLEMLDAASREPRSGKRLVDRSLPPILERIGVARSSWRRFLRDEMGLGAGWCGGTASSITSAACQVGRRWAWNVIARLWASEGSEHPPNPDD